MDLQKIKSLITLAANSRLAELELQEGDCVLRLVCCNHTPSPIGTAAPAVQDALPSDLPELTAAIRAESGVQVAEPAATANSGYVVKAPMFGVFCLTPAPNEPPFVKVGDTVKKGQKLCMLEAMKLFHVLEADRDGTIIEILAENGQEVDTDQPLMRIA